MKLQSMLPMVARAMGFALVLAAMATPAFAISPAPEIDPGLIPSALVLLVGGVLALKARRRSA